MEEFKLPSPELEVKIYFLKTEEGGRKHNISSNYRGQFFYDGKDYDALYQYANKSGAKLGEYSIQLVQFISPNFHIGKFYEGQEFLIREGLITVGKGKILKVMREDYKRKIT
jgi:translation elongation factor EF-Tu-like GTPase